MDIWNLTPGTAIQIVKTFRDCNSREFSAGSVLHYKNRNFLPYHGGHTVYFNEATMYLCDLDETGAIVQNPGDEFFRVVES